MEIGLYLIVSFCSILGILFVGNFLLGLITDTKKLPSLGNTFLSFFTGIIFLVCLTAIIRTGFKSILIGPLILFSINLFINRSKLRFHIRPLSINKQHLLLAGAIIIGFFIIQLLPVLNLETFQLQLPEKDILFYGSLSKSLQAYGVENSLGYENQLSNVGGLAEPYHYFLEWFNSLFSIGSWLNSTYSLILISSPIISCIIAFGFGAVLENYFPSKKAFTLLSLGFLALFVSGWIPLHWFQSQEFKELQNLQLLPVEHSSNLKVLPYYLFIIASIYFIIKDKPGLAVVAILSLIFLNPLFAPVIIIFFIGILLWQLFNRNIHGKVILRNLILLVVATITFFSFYALFGNPLTQELSFLDHLTDSNYIADIYYLISTIPQETLATYSFWIFIFLVMRFAFKTRVNKTIRAINFCSIGFYFITLGVWVMLRYLGPDTDQLVTVLGISVLNLTMALNIIYLVLAIPKKSIRISFTLVSLALICTSSISILSKHSGHRKSYSKEFVEEAAELNNKYGNPNKLVLLNKSSYQLTISNKYPILSSTLCGGYFHVLPGQDRITSIDALDIPISKDLSADFEIKMIEASPYYQFISENKLDANSPMKYAQHTNSRILICESENRVPACFTLNELERLIDRNTGEVILVLKEPPYTLSEE